MLTEHFDDFIASDLALLRERRTGRMHILNRTAAFVWCCLAEGMTTNRCASEMASVFGVDGATAERDVSAVLEALSESTAADSEKAPPFWRDMDEEVHPPSTECRTITFSLGSMSADLRAPTELSLPIEALFGHALRTGRATEHHVLDLVQVGSDLALVKNRTEISRLFPAGQLIPVIIGALHWLRFGSNLDCMRIHAAAVTNGARTLLLCGTSGSGKSTLAAALCGLGFTVVTDDLAQVDSHGTLHGLPLAIGLKSGSWKMLEPYLGSLAHLPSFERLDGKIVKYLTAPFTLRGDTCGADTLVFVSHGASQSHLRELSTFEAAARLSDAGLWAPPEWPMRTLVDWLLRARAFELTGSGLDDSVRLAAGLLS